MLDTLQWSKSNLLVAVQGDSPDTVKEPVSLQMKKAPEPRLRGLSRTSSFPYRHSGLQDHLRLNTERQKPGASQHTGVRQLSF